MQLSLLFASVLQDHYKMEKQDSNRNELEEELASFRQHWKEELKNSANNSPCTTRSASPSTSAKKPCNDYEADAKEEMTNKAKVLFLKGVEYEQEGNTSAALTFYRQAVKLVPDIESKISDYDDDYNQVSDQDSGSNYSEGIMKEECTHDSKKSTNLSEFIEQFQKISLSQSNKICEPEFESREMHISILPVEVLLYIFKWVVSSDVDMLSLEKLSLVCKGFYALARDPDIWRVACLRTWGINCGVSAESWNGCWRTMFIQRPRLQCNGVYISKCAYVRQGDPTSVGRVCPLYQVVEYYRYLRFFVDGYVLAVTTAEEPAAVIPYLKTKNHNFAGVNIGIYHLLDNKVNIIIEKKEYSSEISKMHRGRRRKIQPTSINTFNMEMHLQNTKRRKNAKLEWVQYTCHTFHRNTGQTILSHYDLNHQFTPFHFSRVKSFTDYSQAPV